MGKYTVYKDEKVDVKVEADLNHIVTKVISSWNSIQSIILVGGFGRGEGSVLVQNGVIKPLNDYDLVIVSKKKLTGKKLHKISTGLADELEIDYVDLGFMHPKQLASLPPTMFNYDMKYGSKVIYGDRTVLDKIPNYSPKDVPLWEGVRLLFNRMAGMLGGISIEHFSRELTDKERKYLINQINKALLACIDALLLCKNRYSHLYQQKLKMFKELYPSSELIELAEIATEFKLKPSYGLYNGDLIKDYWFKTVDALKETYLYVMEIYLDRKFNNLLDIPKVYLSKQKSNTAILHNICYIAKLYKFPKNLKVPLNHIAYITLPSVLFAKEEPDKINMDLLKSAEELLSKVVNINAPEDSLEKWEYLRKNAFGLWESVCH